MKAFIVPNPARASRSMMLAFRYLTPALSGFVISWLVVRNYSADLWGAVVNTSLWVYLLSGILSWGSKDYLLRAFSREPANISGELQSSVITRLLLFVPASVALYFLCRYNLILTLSAVFWLFARFLFNSAEPLVIYRNDFGLPAFLEPAAALIPVSGILLMIRQPEPFVFLLLLGTADACKAAWMALHYRHQIFRRPVKGISFVHITAALPFFLTGMAGLLQSRSDQMFVNILLDDQSRAAFQVFINLLLSSLMLPALLVIPLLRSLYRSRPGIFRKVWINTSLAGLMLAPLAATACWLVAKYVYGFGFNGFHLVLAVLFCYPVYISMPLIYNAYRENRQGRILYISLACLALCIPTSYVLTAAAGVGGALCSSVIGQWLMLFMVLIFTGIPRAQPSADTGEKPNYPDIHGQHPGG